MKASKEEIALHNLILNKNKLAFTKVHDLLAIKIFEGLKKLYPKVSRKDDAVIMDAVSDGFLGYFKKPQAFDPNKATLERFLHVAAERDLINMLDKEDRAKKKIKIVELGDVLRNRTPEKGLNPVDAIIEKETNMANSGVLDQIFDNPTDIELATLVTQKVRETSSFVKVLGIEHLPPAKQKLEVKKHKDRIKVALKRNLKQ